MPDDRLIPKRPEYYVQTGSMFENPYGVPHDEIVAMLLELPSEVAAQVIFGKYVESSGLVFSGELVQMMFDRTLPRVTGDRYVDVEALQFAKMLTHEQKKTKFATGIDWARITDYTVLLTLDLRFSPAKVVYYRRLNRVPWEGLYREAGRVVAAFGPNVLSDGTGMAGDIILDALQERHYCPIHDRVVQSTDGGYGSVCRGRNGAPLGGCDERVYIPLGCVDGFQFSKSTKQGLIEHLRNVLSYGYRAQSEEPFGKLRCPPIVQLEEELSFYAWDDKGLETDTVMALALAAYQGLDQMPGESFVGSPYGK